MYLKMQMEASRLSASTVGPLFQALQKQHQIFGRILIKSMIGM